MNRLSSALAISVLALLSAGCHGVPTPETKAAISVAGGRVEVDPQSGFMRRLKIAQASAAPGDAMALRTIGQMLALANPSGALAGSAVSWVELDPALTRQAGLSLGAAGRGTVGIAYGSTWVPLSYAFQMRPGERVEIARYGLRKTSATGTILSIRPAPNLEGRRRAQVVFSIQRGQDWYPGTNCEIVFPLRRNVPIEVPATALIHRDLQEYVMKEVAPGAFLPIEVAISGETDRSLYVLGVSADLKAGDRVVGQGAILLKPTLEAALAGNERSGRAP